MKYRIEFDRIGRNHSIEPLITEAKSGGDLAKEIWAYAKPYLRSRDVDINLDIRKGTGFIVCGMHNGGEFTIKKEAA